ncbi:MAG: pyridine nucleotide-disulfide oxidoreductase [Rhodobacteraceae bacterium]|nr:pyridine nucleotide-disulfide oxidoreductase [Paracoccaceae bacterium]
MARFVIIGAGQAGATLVETLRKRGFDGEITMIGEEPVPPYQRPPLSKGYLLGDMDLERLFLRPAAWYADHNVTLHTSVRASKIDPKAQMVMLNNGKTLRYDKLALATGAEPHRLPARIGGELAGVYSVRSLADVDAMKSEFTPGRRVLVIGGGYIGLEAAAVAAKLGLKATLVEMADRILQRVAARETSDYFRQLHGGHGVELVEGVGVDALLGEGQITGARLTDGRELAVDFAIVGVGVAPRTALAEAAGLEIENGIKTDAMARTSDSHIYAAGDCASTPVSGAQVRIESVGNAIDQAQIAAANMMGEAEAYTPKPWFWSDQFDVKLQIAGLNTGYDSVVVRGEGASVSHWYYKGNTLLAVDAMNDPRAYMVGKRLIEAGKSPAAEMVADTSVDLKAIMASG